MPWCPRPYGQHLDCARINAYQNCRHNWMCCLSQWNMHIFAPRCLIKYARSSGLLLFLFIPICVFVLVICPLFVMAINLTLGKPFAFPSNTQVTYEYFHMPLVILHQHWDWVKMGMENTSRNSDWFHLRQSPFYWWPHFTNVQTFVWHTKVTRASSCPVKRQDE